MLYRKVIHIRAEDSPNVQQRRAIVPGVLTWEEYKYRRATWDKVRQCIGLDGQFWEGAELLLFPPEWLNRSEWLARELKRLGIKRQARAIGIDPAEGGDDTAMAAGDELGLIELASKKTPDTSVVCNEALAFMRKHGVEPRNVVFDRGGGGKQHADRLASMGYRVRTVAFGEPVVLMPKRGLRSIEQRVDNLEDRYAYLNRRAEMYGELSLLCDPNHDGTLLRGCVGGFAIPVEYEELRRQLAVFPRLYNEEGRMYLPPKNKRDSKDTRPTLTEMIGNSPDEADAVVLMVHAMLHKTVGAKIMVG